MSFLILPSVDGGLEVTMKIAIAIGLCAGLISLSVQAADVMTLTSKSFQDGGQLASKYGGNLASNPNCSGENVSPQLAWSNAPPSTRSFAILIVDPDGRRGLGVDHWVAYGIDAKVSGFSEDEVGHSSNRYVHGVGTRGLDIYTGPCAPPGTGLHHYVITLIATDLAPDALPPGLTREEVLKRLDGHTLAATSLVARSGHAER
jgi:Raf kinase inhibitor-like YbhB/YbcL family protein